MTTSRDASGPHYAVFLPQIRMSFDTILERVLVAEAEGFRSVWLMDHLWAPGAEEMDSLEGWTLATALAVRTERIRLGHLVLCNQFRHPALLAKMAVTLDHISGGRLELGLGWGSVPAELAAFGVNDEPAATRSARLAETLEILELLFSGERVSYQGRFHQLRGALARPRPTQKKIPIHIGGAGPKLTLPLVAKHADWWNCISHGADRLAELRPLIGKARVSIQRPLALAENEDEVEAVRARAEKRFGGWGGLVAGTASQVAEVFAADVRAGAELFIMPFADGGKPETLKHFMSEVAPAVSAALA